MGRVKLKIEMGRRIGKLVVTGYVSERNKYEVCCDCGKTEAVFYAALRSGKDRCRVCSAIKRQRQSWAIDTALLDGLESWMKIRIIRRYAEHLRTCKAYRVWPTAFKVFVTECSTDPALLLDY